MATFRKDIQGLRALAVLGVVAYHFSPDILHSGFAGVDIFFVISGYLMTRIIFTGIHRGSFSVKDFYIARAKRIMPALTVTCAFSLAIGYLLIDPMTLKEMGRHAFSAITFYSNYIFLSESGYFDQSSKEKFFLHTWSLSVEWQFYLIYPLVILLANRFLGKNSKHILTVMFFASLFYSTYLSSFEESKSYYFIESRAWEMIAGGLAFLTPCTITNRKAHLYYISLAAIVISLFAFNELTPWPAPYAMIPVISTAMLIWVNYNSFTLDNVAMQFIGRISYSLYLVHWVFLVMCKKLYIDLNFISYFAISAALAAILHYSVEAKRNFSLWHAAFLVVVMIATHEASQNGFTNRIGEYKKYQVDAQKFRDENEGSNGIKNSNYAIYINSNESNFDYILLGNSHARHYYSYLMNSGTRVASLALDGCNSTRNYYSKRGSKLCSDRYKQAVSFINTHPGKPVIWASDWSRFVIKRSDDFDNFGQTLQQQWAGEIGAFIDDTKISGSRVYLIGDTPGAKYLTFECLAKHSLPLNRLFGSPCAEAETLPINAMGLTLENIAKDTDRVRYIDTYPALCGLKSCSVIKDETPIYTDYGHLSKYGSGIVGSYVFKYIEK